MTRALGVERWVLSLGIGVVGVGLAHVSAQVAMPEPSLIHGRAIPASELPNGTVTVRVVREAIGNNIAGQDVRVSAGGVTRTAGTDEQGRAEFVDLPVGAAATAEATVDGERLVSQPFTVPSTGGLRVILVAGLERAAARREEEAAAAAAAPPVSGAVILGGDSRILMQFSDDALQVFYVLDIVNSARAPVNIGGPLIVDLPSGAGGASVLAGSSPSATVSGDRVTITGPFAPGTTSVQVGFRLRLDRPNVTVRQTFPAALQQVTVAVQKIGGLSMTSEQYSSVDEVRSDDGTLFLLATGPALPAGGRLTLELSNLPAHSRTPQLVALGLASAMLVAGVWLALTGRAKGEEARRQLTARRDTLLGELAAIELRRRRGTADARHETRQQRLIAELERLYGELDEAGAGLQGGDEGVAA